MNSFISLLNQRIHSLFDILDDCLTLFPHPTIRVFEDVVYKFDVFYKVVYQQLMLPASDIEIVLDTSRIQQYKNETRLLHQLARCIDMNMRLNLDVEPESCFEPEQIHDFIHLLNWSCENTIAQLKKYIVSFSNTPQFDILWKFLQHLENLKDILQHLSGEWYNNDNPLQVDSYSIPPEAGEIYFESED